MDLPWTDEFRRLVIACALRGDLLAKAPFAVMPSLFSASGAPSPLSRLAGVIASYSESYGSKPAPEIASELVAREGAKLGDAERGVLDTEWRRVLDTEIPADATFIYEQVRQWAEYRTMENALVAAADLLARRGPDAVKEARDAVEAAKIEVPGARRTLYGYQSDAEARLALWAGGGEQGERIPTGLPALDRVLEGGPTRREVFYFLAPPKGAKTASLLRVALGAARRRFGVYVATYEMQAMRMLLRVDRMASRSSKAELREGLGRLEAALDGMRIAGAGEMWVEEKPPMQPKSVQDAARSVEKIRRAGGTVDLMVLDFLNIMGAARTEREKRHDLARVSREIAAMGKDMDVLVWSAALVNRQAVNKRTIRKTDIAEAFEVIAVMDGGIAICGTTEMVRNGYRRFWASAGREFEDEIMAGDYKVDFDRMTIDPTDSMDVDALLAASDERKGRS